MLAHLEDCVLPLNLFVSAVNPKYICKYCHGVAYKPITLSELGIISCKKCFEESSNRSNFNIVVDTAIEEEINQYQMKCKCQWVGNPSQFIEHKVTCPGCSESSAFLAYLHNPSDKLPPFPDALIKDVIKEQSNFRSPQLRKSSSFINDNPFTSSAHHAYIPNTQILSYLKINDNRLSSSSNDNPFKTSNFEEIPKKEEVNDDMMELDENDEAPHKVGALSKEENEIIKKIFKFAKDYPPFKNIVNFAQYANIKKKSK